MSKIMQELENKLTAIETLEHMMASCDYKIVACNHFSRDSIIGYNHELFFCDGQSFNDLASAILYLAKLTEH